MPPLLSVVLPCFNASRWLRPALGSILAQAGVTFEVIAIDDGSIDATPEILADYAERDKRIRVIRLKENCGIVNALNVGLDNAEGTYIARMDSDDVALPNRLRRQLDFVRTTGVGLCGSWFVEFGGGVPRTVRWPASESALQAAMLFQNPICHPTLFAGREVFTQFRYREQFRLAEDYDLLVRAGHDFRLANLPEVLLRYRRHGGQATVALRHRMEAVTCRIRLESLAAKGIVASPEEQQYHNAIRSPVSIRAESVLIGIEGWLRKLLEYFDDDDARRVIASQWVRACVRAAPLGSTMWRLMRSSPLFVEAGDSLATRIDLGLLALLKLDYRSRAFERLRRLGLSV